MEEWTVIYLGICGWTLKIRLPFINFFISTFILVWLRTRCFFCFVFFTCRQNQTTVQQWKIAVNFICKLANSSVSKFMNYVSVCATEGIISCGAAPTCIFPHSRIRPSSWDHPTRLDHDWGQDKEKTGEREREMKREKKKHLHLILFQFPNRGVTFHICMEWAVFSLLLFGGGGGWRSSRPLAAHHWDSKSSHLGIKQEHIHKNIGLNYNPRN